MSPLRRLFPRGAPRKWIPPEEVRALGVSLGRDCRVSEGCDFGSEPYLIAIGDHVTLAVGVQFATHDGGVWVFRGEFPDLDVFAPVRIGNNVFIGARAVLLPGTVIEDNCVIGAGSVVRGRIPANSVAAGVPAKVLKPLAEYRAGILAKAVHVRNRPPAEKERILREKFGLPPPGENP